MALPPLAWVPDRTALVTAADVIHRPGCEHADELAAPVEAGARSFCASARPSCAGAAAPT